jgi:signal peptidase II
MRVIPTENFGSWGALARFLLTASIFLGADLLTKAVAFDRLSFTDSRGQFIARQPGYEFIPGWLEFTVTKNFGAVFGIGQGQKVLFVTVSITAILFLFYLFAWSGGQWFYQIILGMLLAGVLGNLYDRLVFGYVRDLIKALPRWPTLFPWIFNIADSLLCTGVGLMLIQQFFQPAAAKTPAANPQPGQAKA